MATVLVDLINKEESETSTCTASLKVLSILYHISHSIKFNRVLKSLRFSFHLQYHRLTTNSGYVHRTSRVRCKHSNGERASLANLKCFCGLLVDRSSFCEKLSQLADRLSSLT